MLTDWVVSWHKQRLAACIRDVLGRGTRGLILRLGKGRYWDERERPLALLPGGTHLTSRAPGPAWAVFWIRLPGETEAPAFSLMTGSLPPLHPRLSRRRRRVHLL